MPAISGETCPAHRLTPAISTSIAEFYSRNLASEVMKGLVQKAKNGGTLGKAPVGYLNVRKVDRGRETRTVEIDELRAPLVQWAFEQYATGDWSLTRLTAALAQRGLTNRPTTHYAEKPLTKASVHRVLKNRYYIGKVTWQGVEYEGTHPLFIDRALFDRVQEVLAAHNIAGEKQRVHHHYLKGSVWCETCGSRLCITKTTNRHGSTYIYFFCLGRNQRRTACKQKAIPVDLVEEHIEEKWRHVRIDGAYAAAVTEALEVAFAARRSEVERDRQTAKKKVMRFTEQRRKLLEAHYAGAIPVDLLKTEQDRITAELESANRLLAESAIEFVTIEATLRTCLAFLTNCYQTYLEAPPQLRRRLNQLVFERFLVGEDDSAEAELTDTFKSLLAPDLLTSDAKHSNAVDAVGRHRNQDWTTGVPTWLAELWATRKPRPLLRWPGFE